MASGGGGRGARGGGGGRGAGRGGGGGGCVCGSKALGGSRESALCTDDASTCRRFQC